MTTVSPFVQTAKQLPTALPIFPLPGAVLLPHGHVPLNIFEPRYLKMIEDALAAEHLVGMIQPVDENTPPQLASVGCAGRIIRYEETSDGRLEILLMGVCRFRIEEELPCLRGYRLVKPAWQEFTADCSTATAPDTGDILKFKGVLRHYLKTAEIELEATIIDKLSIEDLVNSLIAFLPMANTDKQILLESSNLATRVRTFSALLQEDHAQEVRH